MGLTYLYGLVGRRVKRGNKVFYGYKSYPTKSAAQKEAKEARGAGRLARVEKQGSRYVLLVQVKHP